jgi:hypothetical protein
MQIVVQVQSNSQSKQQSIEHYCSLHECSSRAVETSDGWLHWEQHVLKCQMAVARKEFYSEFRTQFKSTMITWPDDVICWIIINLLCSYNCSLGTSLTKKDDVIENVTMCYLSQLGFTVFERKLSTLFTCYSPLRREEERTRLTAGDCVQLVSREQLVSDGFRHHWLTYVTVSLYRASVALMLWGRQQNHDVSLLNFTKEHLLWLYTD